MISCNQDAEHQIIGSWQLDKVKTNQYIKNKTEYTQAMRQMIKTTAIKFMPDKSFGATIWNDTSYGQWKIVKDSLFIFDQSNKENFGVKILKLSSRKLIMAEQSDSLMEILTFIKL
jgi:hypothetical protein